MKRIAAAQPFPVWLEATLATPWPHLLGGLAVLLLDLLTGPSLMFPVLFVLPVSSAAWFQSRRLGVGLALVLPAGRALIAMFHDRPGHPGISISNAAIRMAVLVWMAYLTSRVAAQDHALRRRVKTLEGILPICGFCRRIRDEHEAWLPMEAYLLARSEARFSHTFCPECAERHFSDIEEDESDAPGGGPH